MLKLDSTFSTFAIAAVVATVHRGAGDGRRSSVDPTDGRRPDADALAVGRLRHRPCRAQRRRNPHRLASRRPDPRCSGQDQRQGAGRRLARSARRRRSQGQAHFGPRPRPRCASASARRSRRQRASASIAARRRMLSPRPSAAVFTAQAAFDLALAIFRAGNGKQDDVSAARTRLSNAKTTLAGRARQSGTVEGNADLPLDDAPRNGSGTIACRYLADGDGDRTHARPRAV